jgi:hypothetical protein
MPATERGGKHLSVWLAGVRWHRRRLDIVPAA